MRRAFSVDFMQPPFARRAGFMSAYASNAVGHCAFVLRVFLYRLRRRRGFIVSLWSLGVAERLLYSVYLR